MNDVASYPVDPGRSIGPFRLGMTRAEALAVADEEGWDCRTRPGLPAGEQLCLRHDTIQLSLLERRSLTLIMALNDERWPVALVCDGVDLCRTPITQLVERLARLSSWETYDEETFNFLDIGLRLTLYERPRTAAASAYAYFENVTVLAPGTRLSPPHRGPVSVFGPAGPQYQSPPPDQERRPV